MHPHDSSDLRYPIGNLLAQGVPPEPTPDSRREAIQHIAELPGRLSAALAGLTSHQTETPYRDGGWTLRQLAHHVADSHMNACVRLRLALTEDWPTIRPYEQSLWAELADARSAPVELSLALLAPLHGRWVQLLHSLDETAWRQGYVHPEMGPTSLGAMTALYSWHGRHHTAHVLGLRQRMGW